jgi:hypothetical protein
VHIGEPARAEDALVRESLDLGAPSGCVTRSSWRNTDIPRNGDSAPWGRMAR